MPADTPRRRLDLVPAGGVSLPLLAAIGQAVDAALGTAHRVAPSLDTPFRWNTKPGMRSGAVLDALLARARAEGGEGALLLAVTGAALVADDGSVVFGEAAVGGGCAVLGLGGLDRGKRCDEKTLTERARKGAIHEAAHAIGMDHCANPSCVMYPARDIADVDRKAIGFCARCRMDLAHATLDAARV
ncbi:MAG TPA: archaemetzincin [Longimicrobium sp.]|nr:archaemetzincin [Longimicrobium sp.]